MRETNPYCMFISIPEGSHLTMKETGHCGRSASMSALLKNGPGSFKFGESGPRGAHIRAPTCLSGYSFDTIGHEMQYGPVPLFLTTQKARSG